MTSDNRTQKKSPLSRRLFINSTIAAGTYSLLSCKNKDNLAGTMLLDDNPPILPMKKLINDPRNLVKEELMGLALAHPELIEVHFDPNYIHSLNNKNDRSTRVAIISGGGSGHEPLHTGYVGLGMLDAACPGAVFTSPTPDQMLAATLAVNKGGGVLQIVMNNDAEIANFNEAARLAKSDYNIEVTTVIINDDIAVQNSTGSTGYRGGGTTILAQKICGAAAQSGQTLAQVAALCSKVNSMGRSMGMALTSCTVPANGQTVSNLPNDQMEIGIGIRGEPGRSRMPLKSADEIAEILTRPILARLSYKKNDRFVAMVSGMGGTPLQELYIIYRKLEEICMAYGVIIVRRLVGNYITSLEMAGCSITLLKVDDEMLNFWDAPVNTVSLRWKI